MPFMHGKMDQVAIQIKSGHLIADLFRSLRSGFFDYGPDPGQNLPYVVGELGDIVVN
jgi:hypothetical protein